MKRWLRSLATPSTGRESRRRRRIASRAQPRPPDDLTWLRALAKRVAQPWISRPLRVERPAPQPAAEQPGREMPACDGLARAFEQRRNLRHRNGRRGEANDLRGTIGQHAEELHLRALRKPRHETLEIGLRSCEWDELRRELLHCHCRRNARLCRYGLTAY